MRLVEDLPQAGQPQRVHRVLVSADGDEQFAVVTGHVVVNQGKLANDDLAGVRIAKGIIGTPGQSVIFQSAPLCGFGRTGENRPGRGDI